MLIDTHAHLQFRNYDTDREKIFQQCFDNEIGMIVVGCDYQSSKRAVELASHYKIYTVYASVGQHPTDTNLAFDPKAFQSLVNDSDRIVGIGECGLDYYHLPKDDSSHALKKAQKELFFQHVELSHQSGLPLIIHCRDAHDDMIQILIDHFSHGGKERVLPQREHGVMHCFTGTLADAQSYLDLGFLISFTGIITFASQYDDIIRAIPLEKILIETDSPFLTPTPFRGKKNSPLNVKYVAQRIADIKDGSFEQVAHVTTQNAKRLFGIA